jgi:hypothetical protein
MAERVLAAKPTATVAGARRKVPAKITAGEDAYEREAESAADAVMNGRPLVPPTQVPAPIPLRRRQREDEFGAGPGRELDPATRHFMELRFGYDFSRVRIHTDEQAARSASSLGAWAYTSGTSIVFARNGYDPRSRAARHLLAHELTHVVQQSRASHDAGLIQCKPKKEEPVPAPPAKWYQEVIDALELSRRRMDEDRKKNILVIPPPYYENEKALVDLCEAVDRQAKEEVPKKLDAVLKLGLWVHLQILSRALLTELSARMYEMGLEADAERLRKAYAAEDRFGPYNDDIYAARRKVDFYKRLVSGAILSAKADTPEWIATTIHHFVRTFVALRDEYAAIDMAAVEQERRQQYGYKVMRPGMSHEEFYLALRGEIERWQRGLSIIVQNAMDRARQDLESPKPTGAGAALLKALRVGLAGELREALFPTDEKKDISAEAFDVTKTTIKKGSGSIGDAFPEDQVAPRPGVPITTYDPEQEYVRELRSSLAQFWRARLRQIDVLGRVYGVLDVLDPDKDFAALMRKAEEATDNAATIRRMTGGRLRLESDDDWRVFLLQKYNDLVHPPAPAPAAQQAGAPAPAAPATARKPATPVEALHTIVDLLFAYLRAFTVHARFTNLYDIGEQSYINRPFPRALTGQLVHDCGVYALRVAYMLSLVRKELGLRFRFVVLPVHVSLVITGDNLPTFITENDEFKEFSPAELEELRKQWEQFKDPTTGMAPAGPSDDEQFLGELAARAYIPGPVDMPFRVTDVPPPVADAKAEQRRLWAFYQKAATADVFGPSSQRKGDPNYLFHQHYLALTEDYRRAYNEAALPFWNKAAPDVWDAFQKKLTELAKKTPGNGIAVDSLLIPLGEYKVGYEKALKPLKDRYGQIEDQERRLSARLRSDPKLVKPGVRISAGARANSLWHFYWDAHVTRIENYETDLVSRPTDAKETIDDVNKALQPPFVPRDEKKLLPAE